ncbi:MAG: restriction endonuclease subunit S [Methanobrevibacter sp.]|nr:restriction endonuclease subunit S [Methanobrevibacter sp.]
MSNIINFNQIIDNNYSFSAKLYETRQERYVKSCKLRDFLISPVKKGIEIGSDAYTLNKQFRFIRTSNILKTSFLVDETSCVGVPESFFENHDLNENSILIVKDGSLGNVAFLDKDYQSFMISSGINVLNCRHPFYVFSILQHELFKENFEYNVASGSTISHAKDIFLDFDIPLPDNQEVIGFVENIMESIILKERLIRDKIFSLNNYISELLNFNGFDNIGNSYPTYSDLISVNRLDAGYYSKKSMYIRNLIESYDGGFFYLSSDNLKGGNTPKIRSEPSKDELSYKWIVPAYIDSNGLNCDINSMDFTGKNNIDGDTCLIINRTSKKTDGQSGKYVGIASFYDYSFFGEGHHNQGFYRLVNMDKVDLITIVAILNHPIYREYFGEISVGSKMKEIKKYNLIEIPLPDFSRDIKNKIKELYFNELKWDFSDNGNFKDYDRNWCSDAGIFDLYIMLNKQKAFLNEVIENIYNNEWVELTFDY